MQNLIRPLASLVIAASFALGAACSALPAPGMFDPAGPRDLVDAVYERTLGYVQADLDLPAIDEQERVAALIALKQFVYVSEPVSTAAFEGVSAGPFAWHDEYVRNDPALADWQRDSDLLSTEILREHFWPPSD